MRRSYGILALLFIVALALRLAVVWHWGEAPMKDALEYHSIAVNLISGHGYAIVPDVATTYRPPVYPLFLALIYRLFGVDYQYVLYAQAVLNAMLLLPLFWLARRLTASASCGLFAAGLFAVHTSFEIVGRLYAENLLIPLGIGFAASASRMMSEAGRWGRWPLYCGIYAGLMGLTKPEYGLLGVGLCLMGMLFPVWRRNWRKLMTVAAVSLLMVGGWSVRNQHVPVQAPTGPIVNKNILTSSYYPAISGNWWQPVTDMEAYELLRDKGRAFYDAIQDAHKVQTEALHEMATHPLGVAKLVCSRILILWVSPPVGSSLLAERAEWLRWLVLILQDVFVVCAFGMLLYSVRARPEMVPYLTLALYMTAVYGLIHSIRRYGYPFVPELCILAGWAFWQIVHSLRAYRTVRA